MQSVYELDVRNRKGTNYLKAGWVGMYMFCMCECEVGAV